ncbi:MAG: J domain-containing protein [Porcipelethomonas sp.]
MTYYDLLQVSSNASIEIIKASYKAMAKKYHPDICGDNGEMMMKINEAYAVLSNPDRRRQYDEMIKTPGSDDSPKVKHETNKPEEKSSNVNKDDFDSQNIVIKIIVSVFYLIGSGIVYILEFAWGIILILIIIGLFTGHTQNLFSKLLDYITGLIR